MTKVWCARACLCHMAPQLPIGKFTCSSHRSTWRGQHSHTFLHQITKTNYLQMSKNVLESMDSSLTQIINFKKKKGCPFKTLTCSSSAALPRRSVGIAPSFRNNFEANPALYCPRLRKHSGLKWLAHTCRFLLTVSGGFPLKIKPSHCSLVLSEAGTLSSVLCSSVQPTTEQFACFARTFAIVC